MSVTREYQPATPLIVPMGIEYTHITSLVVRFHPKDAHRASVMPEQVGRETLARGVDTFKARIIEYRARYSEALLGELHAQGKTCTITKAAPVDELLMFEFTFDCA